MDLVWLVFLGGLAALEPVLTEYLELTSAAVLARNGTIDKFIGDAVMAFWGAPVPNPNHAAEACAAALDCQRRLDRVAVYGRMQGIDVFELLAMTADSSALPDWVTSYEAGLDAYAARDWHEAIGHFQSALEIDPALESARQQLDRARRDAIRTSETR